MAVAASTTQSRLARAASVISAQVTERLQGVQAAQARARAAQEARDAEKKARTEQRTRLARKGFARLMKLGESEAIQNLIQSIQSGLSHGREAGVLFWDFEWCLIGPSFQKTVGVSFRKHGLHIATRNSCWMVTGETFVFRYKAKGSRGEVVSTTHKNQTENCTLNEFFERIQNPYLLRLDLVAPWVPESMRERDPDEDEVIFQFLVRCGRKSNFDQYLQEFLAELEKRAGNL